MEEGRIKLAQLNILQSLIRDDLIEGFFQGDGGVRNRGEPSKPD